jgi:hypothetical protein
MARRLLADFDAELLLRLANRTDITAAMRNTFLNDAYRWACISYKHPEIEAETTGTLAAAADEIIPLASDVWWYETVQNSDTGRVLEVGDKDVIENMIKQTAEASKFYWWASRLRTDRKAAAITNFALWYVKKVPEITTSPLIDELFDPILIMKAAGIGLSTVRDFKESAMLNAEIDKYTQQWSLPKRESKKVMTGAAMKPRLR